MATNEEVARALEELADFVQGRGELIFKVRSYRNAAGAIRAMEVPLERFRLEHDLREIPGVGPAIAKKVAGMLDLGPGPWLAEYVAKRGDREKRDAETRGRGDAERGRDATTPEC